MFNGTVWFRDFAKWLAQSTQWKECIISYAHTLNLKDILKPSAIISSSEVSAPIMNNPKTTHTSPRSDNEGVVLELCLQIEI